VLGEQGGLEQRGNSGMTEITIALDDRIAEKAKRVASQRGISVADLIRELLEGLEVERRNSPAAADLERSFAELSRPMGGIDWKCRDELHER